MKQARLFALFLLFSMPLCALAETAYAIPTPSEPTLVSFDTLVANGVLCGLPEHAARNGGTSAIEDESTTATAVLPCHDQDRMGNGYHDCCCIKTANDLAGNLQEGPVTDALGESAKFSSSAVGVLSKVTLPVLSRVDTPESPPPSLI